MQDERDTGSAPAVPAPGDRFGVDRGDKVHVFRGADVTVTWSRRRCIHVAACVMNLPDVFQPGRRPWVDVAEGSAGSIARVVERCPTGSLHFTRSDGGPAEAVPAANTVRVARHGPLYLNGDLEVLEETGALRLADTRVALCRCGSSANPPLCDGAHLTSGFHDPGEVAAGNAMGEPGQPPGKLRVTPRPGGPLKLEGPFSLTGAGGTELLGSSVSLCRCGRSRNKPFCDGSHELPR